MIHLFVFLIGFGFAFLIFGLLCFVLYRRKVKKDISNFKDNIEFLTNFINSEDIENV